MFKFLKEKIKGWVKSSKDKAEEKIEETTVEAPIAHKKKTPEKKTKKQGKKSQPKLKQTKEVEEKVQAIEEKGFFKKLKDKFISKYKISEEYFDEIFDELELILLENNIPLTTIDKIKEILKTDLKNKEINKSDVDSEIRSALKKALDEILIEPEIDIIKLIKSKKPFKILFFGINGSGKTTTISKFTKLLQDNKLSVVLAAADTFRAASIEQLYKHAMNLGVDIIKHDYGADPAAVAFDAIKHAQAKSIDVVLIDTAGRMHTKSDLMNEMKKIVRVTQPDLKIFVGESTTGSDVIEQAKTFDEAVGVDGVILSKADIDEKGGAAISVSHAITKPILFLGTGQNYEDLKPFKKDDILKELEL